MYVFVYIHSTRADLLFVFVIDHARRARYPLCARAAPRPQAGEPARQQELRPQDLRLRPSTRRQPGSRGAFVVGDPLVHSHYTRLQSTDCVSFVLLVVATCSSTRTATSCDVGLARAVNTGVEVTSYFEVDALGGIPVSRGCFERCFSTKKTPPYHSNFSFATLRTLPAISCSVRPHTVRRPRLALGDGAATRVGFFGIRG